MQGDNRIGLQRLEHALFDHQTGAAFLAGRRPFFGGLKDEHHCAVEAVAEAGEHRRRAERRGDMDVMAARVRHADLTPRVRRLRRRLEWQIGRFGDRQRVHVGPDRDHRPRSLPLQHADDASPGDPGRDLQAERAQLLGHEVRRPDLAVRELRMPMDVRRVSIACAETLSTSALTSLSNDCALASLHREAEPNHHQQRNRGTAHEISRGSARRHRAPDARDLLQVQQVVTSIQPAQVFDALFSTLGVDADALQILR